MLRSCYRAEMRFYQDSDFGVPVEWYFVPDERDVVPYAHLFGSRIYDRREETQEALGERYSPVPWRGGTEPGVVSTGGLCGTAAQWELGAVIGDPLPEVWPGTNVSKCCKRPPAIAIGGMGVGGYTQIPPCCAGVTLPDELRVTFSNCVPGCPVLNDIPFKMVPLIGPPPDALPSARWMSVDLFDFQWAGFGRFFLGCVNDIVEWHLYLVPPDSLGYLWYWGFEERQCVPFRQYTAAATVGILMGDCDIISGTLLIEPW